MHFSRDEFLRSRIAQEKGIDNSPPDYVLPQIDFTLAGCERLRAYLGEPMIVQSGYRCPQLNEVVGGSETSQHMAGQAIDFTCPTFGGPAAIVQTLTPARFILGIDQLIQEKTWVHASFTIQPRYQVLDLS